MCVILSIDTKTNHTALTKNMLINAENHNPDGGGIAWVSGDKVKYKKNLNAKQIWKLIKTEKLTSKYIVHFRIKSSGIVCAELSHPFPLDLEQLNSDSLSGECDKVVFHNGTVSDWKSYVINYCTVNNIKLPDGLMSDSKAVAFMMIQLGDNFPAFLDSNDGRFSTLSKDGVKYHGQWKECNGILCSNDYFMPVPDTYNNFDNLDTGHSINCKCYVCQDEKKTIISAQKPLLQNTHITLNQNEINFKDSIAKYKERQQKEKNLKNIISLEKEIEEEERISYNNSFENYNDDWSDNKAQQIEDFEDELFKDEFNTYEYLLTQGFPCELIMKMYNQKLSMDEISDLILFNDFQEAYTEGYNNQGVIN